MNQKSQCFRTVVALLFCVPAANAQNWPQFRGPDGQGRSSATGLPLRWSETENIRWKTPIEGRAWSSPVVLNGRIWLTTAIETTANQEDLEQALERSPVEVPGAYVARHVILKVICIDRNAGQILHDVTLFDVDQPILLNAMNSYASPTPVVASGRVYCDFGSMGTACLDAATARPLWSKRFVVEHQVGPGSSPVLCRNLLILVRDGCDQQYVMAVNATTGEVAWKTSRPPLDTPTAVYRKAFSTPLVIQQDGVEQMIAPGAQWIASYIPSTGEELWRVDTGSTFSNSSMPAYGNGRAYVCTAYGGTKMLAIRTEGHGDVTGTHVSWDINRGTPRRSSPLLVQDQLYMISDRGVASCVDSSTGELQWTERLSGAHSASPLFVDGRVYFFSEAGTTTVIAPGDQFQLLARNQLEGKVMATPAISEQAIILRTDSHLYCIQR
jgi:outer membrane protein assembly factor BamB